MLQTINNFTASVNAQFPLLNKGGCGVFAVHMAKRLQHLVPTKIVMANYDMVNIDQIRTRMKNPCNMTEWYTSNVHFVHLIVEIEVGGKSYHIDSEGVREATNNWYGYPIVSGSFTIDEVSQFVSQQNGWNTRFPRTQIPQIKRRVKNLFARHIHNNRPYQYQVKQ